MISLFSNLIRTCLILFLVPGLALAQHDAGTPQMEEVESLYPGKAYSPWAQRAFPSRVYWGETHLHTGLSLDAGLFGNTTGHDTAYRLARGEEVITSTGLPLKLSRPLDFLVITDHSDMMGIATDGKAAGEAAFDLITHFSQGKIPEELLNQYSPGSPVYDNVWHKIIKTAEAYNEPGRFTAFIGFEWTSVPKGFNLHRNVILRDGGDRAAQVVPMVTQPPRGSTDPLDLYKWLEAYEEKTSGRAFALSHNGNLSNGWMFPIDKTYAGGRVNKEYVTLRAKWEPLYEVTQIKGDGETHPALSPEDEFADYGTWDVGNLDLTELKTPDMLQREYAREALKQGLMLEDKFGTNPYKFGLVGATDAHTSLTAVEEDNFFGKAVTNEPSATRINHPFVKSALGTIEGDMLVASGYQGVWATENTRESLFDAMERKETYATTGSRIMVRFFGGWEFNDNDLRNRQPAFLGYEKGVPMGGDLKDAPSGTAPTFMLIALRDPIGANLDRIQIVKGWMDSGGDLHEKVYDVAWSDDRKPGADGKLPYVGNTVDIEAATWTNTIGASELAAIWTDPDFDADERAFYYVRVLEIPTPRWVLYDVVRLGAKLPEGVELIHQERAYTSPIWYTP
jgi:hypothetical protein